MAPLAVKDGRCGVAGQFNAPPTADARNLVQQVWQWGCGVPGWRRVADSLAGVLIPPINCFHYGFCFR